MRKKLLSLALALILCLTLAAPAFAAGGDFVIENGVLEEYNGPGGDVTIPDGVTSIGGRAFFYCIGLTSVTIPNSVTSIEECAFAYCTWLTEVNISESVTSIGSSAFDSCTSLTGVTIPNGVTSIGDYAFQNCSDLTSVTICGSVTSILRATFSNCIRLTSVTVPDSVTNIGDYAFSRCFSLTDVYYGGTEAQWKAVTIGEKNDELLGAAIHYNSAAPDTPSQSKTASPTNDRLTVNGVLQTPAVYKIGGSNYFKIRDLAAMLNGTEKQFDVGYDAALNSVTVTTGKGCSDPDTYLIGALGGNQTAAPSNDSIYINGQKFDVTVYKIGGSNFFMLRDLGRALDFYVGWTREAGVFIDTSKPYSE